MPRELTPLLAADLSIFAKTLRAQWALRHESGQGAPSHVEMLNLLARAAGHRNVQALRAAIPRAESRAAAPSRGPRDPALSETADRALRQFDAAGRLVRWPTTRALQVLALWGLCLCFDTQRRYSLLRRELIEMKLLARTPGGAEYRKLAARPDAEVVALLGALRQRTG